MNSIGVKLGPPKHTGLAAGFLTKNVSDFHVFVMRSSSFDGWLACTRLRLSSCLSRIRSVVCVCRACRVTVQAGLRVCLGRRVRRAIYFCRRVWRVKVYLRLRQRRDSPAAESALHPHSSTWPERLLRCKGPRAYPHDLVKGGSCAFEALLVSFPVVDRVIRAQILFTGSAARQKQ